MDKFLTKENKRLKLTHSEAKVLSVVETVPQKLVDIENQSFLPHSTVFDTLKSLQKRQLIESVKVGKRKLWKLTFSQEVSTEGLAHFDLEIVEGKEALLSRIYSLFEQSQNGRVLVYHGPKAFAGWYKILTEENITKFNILLKKFDVIVERFVPREGFQIYLKGMTLGYKKSMLDRAQITYVLPDEYFDSKSELILFSNAVVIYETHIPRIYVLKNTETIQMYRNIFEILKKVGRKIDSQQEFKTYL